MDEKIDESMEQASSAFKLQILGVNAMEMERIPVLWGVALPLLSVSHWITYSLYPPPVFLLLLPPFHSPLPAVTQARGCWSCPPPPPPALHPPPPSPHSSPICLDWPRQRCISPCKIGGVTDSNSSDGFSLFWLLSEGGRGRVGWCSQCNTIMHVCTLSWQLGLDVDYQSRRRDEKWKYEIIKSRNR